MLVIDASVRNIEIIGEAVSQINPKDKDTYQKVQWQEIKDFRNVVIHKYNTVDLDIVWDIIQNKLEPLRSQVEEILAKEKAEDDRIKKQRTLP